MTKAITRETENKIGELVRRRRKEMGLSVPNLASLIGAHIQTVNKIESGEIRFSKYFYQLENVLDISIVPAAQGNIGGTTVFPTSHHPAPGRDLPLYGASAMPRNHKLFTNGGFAFTRTPIDMIERPEWLRYNKQAYALKITADAMLPRFNPGERVVIDPLLEPKPGTDVVLLTHDDADHRAGVVAYLAAITKGNWLIVQYNHRKGARFPLARKRWPICHRIVGAIFERA